MPEKQDQGATRSLVTNQSVPRPRSASESGRVTVLPSPRKARPATPPGGSGPGRVTVRGAAREALARRDRALAALDAGDFPTALATVGRGLAVLEMAGLCGGPDEAALLVALAVIQEGAGQVCEARVTVVAAIAILEGAAADWDEDLLTLWCQAQERLAGLERLAGQYGAAAARLRFVVDRARTAFGEGSPTVVSAASALGVVHRHAADFDAAEAAFRQALAAAEAMPERDLLVEAELLHDLGGLAQARGRAAAGIPLAERGTRLRARALGARHPDVARDLNALGTLHHLAGRYGDADHAYCRALGVLEDYYGAGHLEVARTCANLAVLDRDLGRFQDSETLSRRALDILQDVLGPGDAEVGLTLLHLAAAVAGQGRAGEAALLGSRASAILAARLPADHPHVTTAQAWQAYGRAA
jgi:tetratricopeptide (TPR) repeat protein